jgi:RNA polymerase sigma-70 factor (ECF subfamily)
MSLAYIAALQRLAPEERAALVLSDAHDFGVAEIAEMLGCEYAVADCLLTRARAAVEGVMPRQVPDEDMVVSRFTAAFQRGDVAGITALLSRDAWLRMRPLPLQFRGRKAARQFLAVFAFPGGMPSYRLIATRANGQPAFGCYLRDPSAGVDRACGLVMLTVDGGYIAAIDRFVDNSLLPRFGLPRTLPEGKAAG